jgi:hypothetical protein
VNVPGEINFEERLTSRRTEILLVTLTVLFLLVFAWRVTSSGPGLLSFTLIGLSGFFLFYSLSYRTLVIRMTPDSVVLTFGVVRWTVLLENVEHCALDETSLWRIGGAGLHFTSIRGRYRAMLNFLEHPRVVLALRKKRGLVRDVVFSTKRPEEVLRLVREASRRRAAPSPPEDAPIGAE